MGVVVVVVVVGVVVVVVVVVLKKSPRLVYQLGSFLIREKMSPCLR